MNHRGGWALIKSTWSSWMQYRGFFFVLAFGWMIPPLIYLFVWSAAAGNGEVAGISRAEFTAYYLVLVFVNQLTYAQTNWTLGDMIRAGMLNSWLLRPLAPLYQVLSTEVAGKVVFMAFVLPVSLLLAVVLRPTFQATTADIVLFSLSLLLAWGLRFLWGCWLAMLAFWTARADALLAVQDGLVFLLAGVVAPVSLLPDGLQHASKILPFRYMVGFPVEQGFCCQVLWLIFAASLSGLVWRLGLRRYSAIGG